MDDDFVWTPPGATTTELEGFLTLRDGIPAHANESIHQWLLDIKKDGGYLRWRFMLEFQQATRIDLDLTVANLVSERDALEVFRRFNQEVRTWLIDFMLSQLTNSASRFREPAGVGKMRKILRDCGSSWTVAIVCDRFRLQAVVPPTVATIVQSTLSRGDRSSELLQAAWESAFGTNQNASHAYYDAVRAVEVLSCPLISPNDQQPTLGKDINVLRSKPEAWQFAMHGSAQTSSVEHLISMLKLLWHSQSDRHGRANYESVSIDEAQAAVLLAATLVGWLARGMLTRVNT